VIYFAYGSNLDPVQFAARCPGHRVLGNARLPDHRLCFPRRSPIRGCAVASIEPMPGDAVWGVLFALCAPDVTALHAAEGYACDRPAAECRYVPAAVRVLADGRAADAVQAFTYVAVRDGRDPGRPSRAYLDHILRGAAHHGLPRDWQDRLGWLEVAG
jgi:hypothetical protein